MKHILLTIVVAMCCIVCVLEVWSRKPRMTKWITLLVGLFCFNLFGASPSFQQTTNIINDSHGVIETNGNDLDFVFSATGSNINNKVKEKRAL